MNPQTNDIGAYFAGRSAVPPQAASAGAINGTSIDRSRFRSGKIVVQTGAATGTPTTLSVTTKIQDSPDGSTFTDFIPHDKDSANVELTAVNSKGELNINLAGADQYVRLVATTAFTGGSTPTVLVAASLMLGGADILPAE